MRKYFETVISTTTGKPIESASVRVLLQTEAGVYTGTTLASLYSDIGGTVLSNPVSTDANGLFQFFCDNGTYTLEVSYGGNILQVIRDVEIEDNVATINDAVSAAEAAAAAAAESASAATAAVEQWIGDGASQPARSMARGRTTGLFVDFETEHPSNTFYVVDGVVLFDGAFMDFIAEFGPPPLSVFNVAKAVTNADGSAGMSTAGQVPITYQTDRRGALTQGTDNLNVWPAYFPFGDNLTLAVDATKLGLGSDGLFTIYNEAGDRQLYAGDNGTGTLQVGWFKTGTTSIDPDNFVSSLGTISPNTAYPAALTMKHGEHRVAFWNEMAKNIAYEDANSSYAAITAMPPRRVQIASGTTAIIVHKIILLPDVVSPGDMVALVGSRPIVKASTPLIEFKERSVAFSTARGRDGCHVVIDDGEDSGEMRAVALPYEQHIVGVDAETPRRPVARNLSYRRGSAYLRRGSLRTLATPPNWALGLSDMSHFAVGVHPRGATQGQIDFAMGYIKDVDVTGSAVETDPIQWGTVIQTVSDELVAALSNDPTPTFTPDLAPGAHILPSPNAHIPWGPEGTAYSNRALLPVTHNSNSRCAYRNDGLGAWTLGAVLTGNTTGVSFDEWWGAWAPDGTIVGTARMNASASIAIIKSTDGGATLSYVKTLGTAQNFNGYAAPHNLIQIDEGATVSAMGELILAHPLGTSALSHGLRLHRLSGSSPETLAITHYADVLHEGQATRGCRIDPIFGVDSNLFLVSIDYSLAPSINERAGVVSMVVEPQWVAV